MSSLHSVASATGFTRMYENVLSSCGVSTPSSPPKLGSCCTCRAPIEPANSNAARFPYGWSKAWWCGERRPHPSAPGSGAFPSAFSLTAGTILEADVYTAGPALPPALALPTSFAPPTGYTACKPRVLAPILLAPPLLVGSVLAATWVPVNSVTADQVDLGISPRRVPYPRSYTGIGAGGYSAGSVGSDKSENAIEVRRASLHVLSRPL